ncbi:MAG: dihydrofolate reductase family protein [Verrucomicrobia bacterium]|nr:dihydrofolate reductase family protein [Verrucomicrobiota bacterium]
MSVRKAAARKRVQRRRTMGSGRSARPWISLNMAMTADGKTATATRSISSFGSPHDRRHLYELRAQADAVMTGAGTVRSENADLAAGANHFRALRRRNGLSPENLRVVVSRGAKLSPALRVFSEPGGALIILTTRQAHPRAVAAAERRGAAVARFGARDVDLPAAIRWLADAWKVRRLHCEGGAELNQALFAADLVDEIHVTWCPWIFGGRTSPTLAEGVGFGSLAEARRFRLSSVRQRGKELFLRFVRESRALARSAKGGVTRRSARR